MAGRSLCTSKGKNKEKMDISEKTNLSSVQGSYLYPDFWKWKVTVTFSSTTGNSPSVWEETGQPPQARGCCVQKVEIVDFCNYFPSETLWKHPYHWIHRNECQVSLGATSPVFPHIITLSTSIFSFLLIYIYFYSVFIYLTRCYWIPDNMPRSKNIKFKWIHPHFLWLT